MTREELWNKVQGLINDSRGLLSACERENRDPKSDVRLTRNMAEIQALEAKIAALDGNPLGYLDSLEARANASTYHGAPPLACGSPLDAHGFRDLDDFLTAVTFHDHNRLQGLATRQAVRGERRDMSAGVPAAGGVLVPPQFAADLLTLPPEIAAVRPRAFVVPAGEFPDAPYSIPALDYTAGRLAGVTVSWIDQEGGDKPKTEPEFDQITLTPREFAAHIVLTDKLMRNAAAAGAIVRRLLTEAMVAHEEQAFLTGNGVGQPLGVLASPCRIQIPRTGPGAIVWADVLAMLGALVPGSLSRRNTVWVASPTALPQLLGLEDTANTALVRPGATLTGAPPSALYGIPIVWSDKVPALGNPGDLMLCDFSFYVIKNGSGPFIASDGGIVNFTNNKTIVKGFSNVDAHPWLSAPLTLRDGVTQVSPFVVLQ